MVTTYFLNNIAGNIFGTKTDPALPSEYYIGLSTTAPTTAGENVTEPSTSGTGYSRVKVTSFSEPDNGAVTIEEAVAFPESTADWGTVTHYVLYDAITGGNLLIYDPLNSSRHIDANTSVVFQQGSLTIAIQNVTA